MIAKGNVIFKGLEKRSGGTFNNGSQDIKYDSAYIIKFDEVKDGKINERKLKFPVQNSTLYKSLRKLKPYTEILLVSDVVFSSNSCKLVPLEFNYINKETGELVENVKEMEDTFEEDIPDRYDEYYEEEEEEE